MSIAIIPDNELLNFHMYESIVFHSQSIDYIDDATKILREFKASREIMSLDFILKKINERILIYDNN